MPTMSTNSETNDYKKENQHEDECKNSIAEDSKGSKTKVALILDKNGKNEKEIKTELNTDSVETKKPFAQLLNEDESLFEDNDAPTKDVSIPSSSGSQSPQKSSLLFRQKETRDSSPFKEVLKGFMLSKLSHKKGPADSTTIDHEKRTFMSGIKEKLVKKLEDSQVSTQVSYVPEQSLEEKQKSNASSSDAHQQELKSVVANDQLNSVPSQAKPRINIVEEADECFEETQTTDIINQNVSGSLKSSCSNVSPGPSTPRSKTIENISSMVRKTSLSKMTKNKTISMTFSDLQRAEDMESEEESQNPAAAVDNSLLQDEKVLTSVATSQVGTDGLRFTETSVVAQFSLKQLLGMYVNLVLNYVPPHVWIQVLVVGVAIAIIYVLPSNPFLAGVLCGMAVIVVFFVSIEIIYCIKQKNLPHYPSHKPTPITSDDPHFIPKELVTHEGWMNELVGSYDPNTFSMSSTMSVYLQLKGSEITFFYPKRNVAKHAIWNEEMPLKVPFIHHISYSLIGAKVQLLPENLPERRLWNKRFPLAVLLPVSLPVEQLRKFPSVELLYSKLETVEEAETKQVTQSSSSLPSSLANSPAHKDKYINWLYLFARTDREKEEWYSKLCSSIPDPEPPFSNTVSEAHSSTSGAADTNVPVASTSNPELPFSTYMNLVLQLDSSLNASDPHIKLMWLNALVGRLFYDFFTQKKWARLVQERIQIKLNTLKMPQFMKTLTVTDIYLGTSLPKILSASAPTMDERGLWVDVDIDYKGSFQLTLETKLRSMGDKISTYDTKKKEQQQSISDSRSSNDFLDEISEEEEDISEIVSVREESLPQPSLSTGEKLIYSVEKWIQSSNLSENSFVKRCVGHLMQTRLLVTVEVNHVAGTLALNLPNAPTDRLWYGFRRNPQLSVNVQPQWNEHHISILPFVTFLKRKLIHEFQKAIVMPNMEDVIIPIMHSSLNDPL